MSDTFKATTTHSSITIYIINIPTCVNVGILPLDGLAT